MDACYPPNGNKLLQKDVKLPTLTSGVFFFFKKIIYSLFCSASNRNVARGTLLLTLSAASI